MHFCQNAVHLYGYKPISWKVRLISCDTWNNSQWQWKIHINSSLCVHSESQRARKTSKIQQMLFFCMNHVSWFTYVMVAWCSSTVNHTVTDIRSPDRHISGKRIHCSRNYIYTGSHITMLCNIHRHSCGTNKCTWCPIFQRLWQFHFRIQYTMNRVLLHLMVLHNKFSYPSSCSRNNADLSLYLSSRSGRACMDSYKYCRAVYVDILVACTKGDVVVSFPVCIYQFVYEKQQVF